LGARAGHATTGITSRAYQLRRRREAIIGVAIGMRVEDVYTQNRRLWLRLADLLSLWFLSLCLRGFARVI